MTHEIIRPNERCIKEGTLLTLGAVSLAATAAFATDYSVHRHTYKDKSDKARVLTTQHPGDYSVLVFPGYHADGEILAKNFDKHLEHLGTTHFVVHPERGMNLDSYKDEILKARKMDGHRPLLIYALSMGALLDAKIASDEDVRHEMGEIHRKVLDSPLSGKGDLDIVSRLGILAGSLLPATFSTDRMYHLVNQLGLGDESLDFDPELVTREEAEERLWSTRRVRYAAAKGQIPFMHRENIAKMDLAQAGSELDEGIIVLSSLDDHLINTRRSAGVISDSYDIPVEFRYDLTRKETSHATGPENPRGVVDALEGKNRDKYMALDIRNTIRKYQENKKRRAIWQKKPA